MFGVSRMTYHKWLSGSPLSDSHREHVLEVQPLMEETIQRLGNSQSVGNWLLTPVSPAGKKPVEYLKERRYNLFRGFLLHTPTGRERFHPVPPSNPVHRERPRSEVEQVRRLLKPPDQYSLPQDD